MFEDVPVRRVGIVLFEGFTVLDVYGPVQAFAGCRVIQDDGKPHRFFEVVTIGAKAGPITAGEGPTTVADYSFADAPKCDILLIPGGFGTRASVNDAAFLKSLGDAAATSATVATVCTGSALLARTGLIDNRPATSNKIAWDWVIQQGPAVDWQRRARWVDDGNIITSSGVSAGIDMALALIQRLCGREMALLSAKGMEYIWNEDPGNDPFA